MRAYINLQNVGAMRAVTCFETSGGMRAIDKLRTVNMLRTVYMLADLGVETDMGVRAVISLEPCATMRAIAKLKHVVNLRLFLILNNEKMITDFIKKPTVW